MYFVYLLESISCPGKRYVGFTEDVTERLSAHNLGKSNHTKKFRPWNLISYHAFSDKKVALDFERYLKTGSGRAFSKKRFCL